MNQVLYDLWCKRHLFFPKISMKVFSDRNFYNLPTNENFCTSCEFHKNRKKVKIPEIIYMMSSYRDEFLRLKMVSLCVLDVFCTVFECATTSTSKFKILSIFAIFDFWFMDFDHSTIEMSTIFHLWVPKFFSKSIIIKLFQKQNVTVNSHYFVLYLNLSDFSHFSIYRLVS